MKIIGIGNQKGGVGKTTLVVSLAGALAKEGFRVSVIDRDPQAAAMGWAETSNRLPYSVHGVLSADLRTVLDLRRKQGDEVVLIDCGPTLGGDFRMLPLLVDLLVLPLGASSLDVRSLVASLDVVKAVPPNARMRYFAVMSRVQANLRITREVIEALDELKIPRFATLIHNRTAYAQAAADGGTVFEGKDQASIDEIRALAREVRNVLSI